MRTRTAIVILMIIVIIVGLFLVCLYNNTKTVGQLSNNIDNNILPSTGNPMIATDTDAININKKLTTEEMASTAVEMLKVLKDANNTGTSSVISAGQRALDTLEELKKISGTTTLPTGTAKERSENGQRAVDMLNILKNK